MAARRATRPRGWWRHSPTAPGIPLLGLAAMLASDGPIAARAAATRRFGSDLPGALAEDALAALLGWLGARRTRAAEPGLGHGG